MVALIYCCAPVSEAIEAEFTLQAPPAYTSLRQNERYDYLADPRNRADPLDSLKYVSLGERSYLTLGGELRERYDDVRNVDYGLDPNAPDDSYWSQRISLHADLHFNPRARVFAQAISGLAGGEERPASPVNKNQLDLQQGFADYVIGTPAPAGPSVTFRGGRFEMSHGSGRFVSIRGGPNIPNRFDGLQVVATADAKQLYAFATYPVVEDMDRFDGSGDSHAFWGVYAVAPPSADDELGLDLYYLGRRLVDARYAAGFGTEERHSVGTRFFGTRQGWWYDWEPVIQFGTFGDRDILAWALGTDTGYAFEARGKPRLGLKANIASGDSGGTGRLGTFNPLFFRHGYFNDAGLVRPMNLIDVHPSLQFAPLPALTATVASDVLWRHRKADAVYSGGGRVQLPAGARSRYVGTTAEAALQWKANRHLSVTVSYIHLFVGDSVQELGGRDINYAGGWTSFVW